MSEQEQTAEYKAAYDKAAKELDEQEKQARGPDGKFVKAEETPAVTLPAETKVEPKVEPTAKVEPDKPIAEVAPDPMAELRAEIARLDKEAKDNKAWGTRNAQELAAIKREKADAERAAARPKILDANPELEAAVRYVAGDPAPKQEADTRHQQWRQAVESVHPGIFAEPEDSELVRALAVRMQALGDQWGDPLTAIREITAEKLTHERRQFERRLAAETAKLTQKSAMSVPGSGGTSVSSGNADADAVARIRNMSDREFEQERRRTLGY